MEMERQCMLCNRPCGEEGMEEHLGRCLTAAAPRWEGREKARGVLGPLPRVRYDNRKEEEELSEELLPSILSNGRDGGREREAAERVRREKERAKCMSVNAIEVKSVTDNGTKGSAQEGQRETLKRRRPAPSRTASGPRMRPTVRVEQSERKEMRHSLHIPVPQKESSPAPVMRAPSVPSLTGGDRSPLKSSVDKETTEEEELKGMARWESQGKSHKKSMLASGAAELVSRALSPRRSNSATPTRDSGTQGESEDTSHESHLQTMRRSTQSIALPVKEKILSLGERQKGGSRTDLYTSLTGLPQNVPSTAAVGALQSTRIPIHQISHKALVVIFCPSNFHFLRMNKAGEVEASFSTGKEFQPDAIFTFYVNGDGSYRFRCKFWKKYLWGSLDVVDSASSLFLRKKKDLEKLCLTGNGVVMGEESSKGRTEPAALHVWPLFVPPS